MAPCAKVRLTSPSAPHDCCLVSSTGRCVMQSPQVITGQYESSFNWIADQVLLFPPVDLSLDLLIGRTSVLRFRDWLSDGGELSDESIVNRMLNKWLR